MDYRKKKRHFTSLMNGKINGVIMFWNVASCSLEDPAVSIFKEMDVEVPCLPNYMVSHSRSLSTLCLLL
jgi:hypothetical protein